MFALIKGQLYLFSVLCWMPLNEYTKMYLSILLLIANSIFLLLKTKLPRIFLYLYPVAWGQKYSSSRITKWWVYDHLQIWNNAQFSGVIFTNFTLPSSDYEFPLIYTLAYTWKYKIFFMSFNQIVVLFYFYLANNDIEHVVIYSLAILTSSACFY